MKDTDTYDAEEANAQSDLNAQIGSLLERWTTRDTSGCRWCNAPLEDEPATPTEAFCDDDCQESWQQVLDARIEIGKRDMSQRGYD